MWVSRIVALLLGGLLLACGGSGEHRAGRPPTADPLFPTNYASWTSGPREVRDQHSGEVRRHYRSPNGAVLVKVHQAPSNDLVTQIDVRRRAEPGSGFEGWSYLAFDPATRRQRSVDAEVCHLCHSTAPRDGTFTRFP